MIRVGVYVSSRKFDMDKQAVMQAYDYCRCKLQHEVKLSSDLEFVVDDVYELVSCISRCDVCFIDAENISRGHSYWINVLRLVQENQSKKFIMFVHDHDNVQYAKAFIRSNVTFVPFDDIERCMEKEIIECTQR